MLIDERFQMYDPPQATFGELAHHVAEHLNVFMDDKTEATFY